MIGSSSWMAVLGSPLFTASSTFFHWSARSGGVKGLAATRTATPMAAIKATEPTTIRREWRVMGEPPRRDTESGPRGSGGAGTSYPLDELGRGFLNGTHGTPA